MTSDYKTMTTAEIRDDFLHFFESKGCKLTPSSSLIPDDPSLLLTNAGMNQFKQYYLGKKTMAEIGATSCQKCLRTNDIDNIGDARHLSFFEMLGNFAFGGYTKQQACEWAYEFITSEEHLGLPKDRLYFTVFTEDDEGAQIWQDLGVEPDHISRLGEDDNFWAAGPTGPCGPCSEIYFDQGEEYGCGKPDCAPGCDCDRYLEFWNLVFTQYDRQEDGSFVDLPSRNIDTGMGLERIAAIMQHQHTNYEGDILRGLIGLGEELSGKEYGAEEGTSKSLRIVADHARAVTFLIADGVLPSNEGRGYVLRRLLRRAVFHGKLLGIEGAFLNRYTELVTSMMGEVYPELVENGSMVANIVAAEEARFGDTLETGRGYLDQELEKLEEGATLSGETAFVLHDTYGFPVDLTREIAENAGHAVDMEAFDAAMAEQRSRARASANREAWSTFNNVWVALSDKLEATSFAGYEADVVEGARVVAIVREGEEAGSASTGDEIQVVLDQTPFYAEMGGQVGDTGTIETVTCKLDVLDVTARGEGLYAHRCIVREGTLMLGDEVCAQVNVARRTLIRRNHTATHLLDAALKKVLGDHVSQAGSLVSPDHLRFDFTHFEATTPEQLRQVEALVNEEIFAAKPVVTQVMGLEEAKASGAVALFGEKYGETVRVVSVGTEDQPFSRELCGGTHASNSAEIGFFKIFSEGSVGSNARRIEAVTGAAALAYVNERIDVLDAAAAELRCRPLEVPERARAARRNQKELENKLTNAMRASAGDTLTDAVYDAMDVNGYKCVITKLRGLSAKELRTVWDGIRDSAKGAPVACVLAADTPDGKVSLLAAGTNEAVSAGFNAGGIIREIAERVGGKGGGRPNMAQAGGRDAAGIDAALELARELLQ